MLIKRIDGATRVFGAPAGHDNETEPLKISDLPIQDTILDGFPFMVSAWEPTPAELESLKKGAPILLYIGGNIHPVVSVIVGDIPDA